MNIYQQFHSHRWDWRLLSLLFYLKTLIDGAEKKQVNINWKYQLKSWLLILGSVEHWISYLWCKWNAVMTTSVCLIKICITDQIQTTFYKKKQTKYRPEFLNIQTKIWKCHSEESKAENRGTMSYTITQIAYLTSSQWKLTQCT